MSEKKPKPLLISTPRGDKSPFDDFWKIKRSELEALKKNYEMKHLLKERGGEMNYYKYFYNCNSKEFKRRYLADFLRLFKYLFTNAFEWAIDKIRQIFWPAVLVIGVLCLCGGIMYSIYWFNENECDRVHNLGYDTDFDFFGGCYVKVNGQWMPFEIQGVNVITEGK